MQNSGHTILERSQAPKRYQTVYGKTVEITDLSGLVEEKVSPISPDIEVISASKLFKQDEVVIGIGRPNVFLLIPDGKGNHLRYAAKSCWRGESKLERTRGMVQSGIFFILTELCPEQIEEIRKSAEKHQGERGATCVNANARVLKDAGISLGNGEELDSIYFPMPIFHAINEYGLKVNDILLNVEKIKTTERYLENQALQVNKAVALTLFRHAIRLFSNIFKSKKTKRRTEKREKKEKIDSPHLQESGMHDLDLQVSNPSKLVVPLRIMWGAHTIFTLNQERVDIDNYLPDSLKAFPQENPSFITKLKRDILFNRFVVSRVNKLMQNGTSAFPGKTEADIHNMFEVDSEEKPNIYNIVASKSGVMISKINIKSKLADWILTKHVLISNYNESVRFAGEIWKDKDGIIWVNNNSGTYRPKKDDLYKFVAYLKEIFPNVDIRAFEG